VLLNIAEHHPENSMDILSPYLNDQSKIVRTIVQFYLRKLQYNCQKDYIRYLRENQHIATAIYGLAGTGTKASFEHIRPVLKNTTPRIKTAYIYAIMALQPDDHDAILIQELPTKKS
jgi:hypothetical protein